MTPDRWTPSVPRANAVPAPSPPFKTVGGPKVTDPSGREEQPALFETASDALSDEIGYRGPVVCRAAGITYRQLDYWARTGLISPSIRQAQGSGSQRLYSFRDILVLKIVKRLLDTGVSLHNIRAAVEHLRDRGVNDLAQVTLMSDGSSVYECTSEQEVIDLVKGGHGVFGIAVGKVWHEIEGTLAVLPGESPAGVRASAIEIHDELAARRSRRTG